MSASIVNPADVHKDGSADASGGGSPTWNDVAAGVGFQNSWVNFGSGFYNAAYAKAGTLTTVRGTIKNGTNSAAAFTLPSGYRPLSILYFPAVIAGVTGVVQVSPNGEVIPINTTSSSTLYATLNFSFYAEP